jgi:23S rRNA (cytosine1962-C5)-methyltransferase
MIALTLKAGKEEPLRRFHPWIFSGAVAHANDEPTDGDLVIIRNSKNFPMALAHFQYGSIMARVISFDATAEPEKVDFWVKKLENALAARRSLGLLDDFLSTNCFRLVHAEGDGLPGLIVDLYGNTAVVQCHSVGMHRQKMLISEALQLVFGEKLAAVYDKSAESLPTEYAGTVQNGYLFGSGASGEVNENGLKFQIDWERGQKTGFFLDQRENRQLLAHFSKNKTVLNAFCYTGGFSMYALQAGATSVDSVDVSQKAMDLVQKNIELNGFSEKNHACHTADVLQFLQKTEKKYDVIVVDPPAYAKSVDKRHNAVQGYKRLNVAAIKNIAPGGVIFTFSCSQVVDNALFYHTITAAAMEAGRQMRVLKHLGQGGDHPVSIFHPEGSYLKGLVLLVE